VNPRGTAARGQRGQAMLEYALISATVVMAFALAGQLGVSKQFVKLINDSESTYNISLLPNELSPEGIMGYTQKFNEQLPLQ
jgi:hypothetical protein